MALDPNISLQGTPPVAFDPVGSIGKAATLKNLMIGNQYLEAEKQSALESQRLQQEQANAVTAGYLQENAQRQRDLDSSAALGEHYRANRFEKKDASGKPLGEFGYDMDKIRDAAYNDPRIDIRALFKLDQDAAKTAQEHIKTKADLTAFADKEGENAFKRLAYAKTPEERASIAISTKRAIELAGKNIDPEHVLNHTNAMFQLPLGPDGKPAQLTAEQADAHLQSLGNQWREQQRGIITAQQEVSNKQTQESLLQTGAGGGTGPVYRDPNSKVSKDARAALAKQGVAVAEGLSYADLMVNPQYKGILAESVVPAATKAAGVTGAIEFENKAKTLDNLARAARAAKLPEGLTIAAIVNKTLDTKLLNDPAVAEYVARVQEANAAGIPIPENNPKAVAAFADSNAKTLRAQGKTAGSAVTAPTFNAVAPASQPPAAPAKPTAPPAGSVRLFGKDKNGDSHSFTVPKEKVSQFIAKFPFLKPEK